MKLKIGMLDICQCALMKIIANDQWPKTFEPELLLIFYQNLGFRYGHMQRSYIQGV